MKPDVTENRFRALGVCQSTLLGRGLLLMHWKSGWFLICTCGLELGNVHNKSAVLFSENGKRISE